MQRQMKLRNKLQDDLAKLSATYACSTELEDRSNIMEQQNATQAHLDYVQAKIQSIQKKIVDLDENILEVSLEKRIGNKCV
jgi:peptidoglycan hydrolase CwlO-like protein